MTYIYVELEAPVCLEADAMHQPLRTRDGSELRTEIVQLTDRV